MRSSIGTIGENTTLDDWLLYNVYSIFTGEHDDVEEPDDRKEKDDDSR